MGLVPDWLKKRWRYTRVYSVYRCSKCKTARKEPEPAMSFPYLFAALLASMGIFSLLAREPWDYAWYYYISILAGEVLLVFVIGIPTSILFEVILFLTGRKKSDPQDDGCRHHLQLSGGYYATSQDPLPLDHLILAIFVVINVLLAWFIIQAS